MICVYPTIRDLLMRRLRNNALRLITQYPGVRQKIRRKLARKAPKTQKMVTPSVSDQI